MKHYSKLVPVLLLIVFGAAACECAMAQHHGGARFGVFIGVPLYGSGNYAGPYYPYPAYAYPPTYAYPGSAYAYPEHVYGYLGPAVPSAPYSAQGYPQAAPFQPRGDWHYCPNSKSSLSSA